MSKPKNKKEFIAAINDMDLPGVEIPENTDSNLAELELIWEKGKEHMDRIATAEKEAATAKEAAAKAEAAKEEAEQNVVELSEALENAETSTGGYPEVTVDGTVYCVTSDVRMNRDTLHTAKQIAGDKKLADALVKRKSGALVRKKDILKAQADKAERVAAREKKIAEKAG